MCNDANSWVDLDITEVTDDGININVDISTVYEKCPNWSENPGIFGYMWMETPCPTMLDCQLYVIGCDQLTEECNDHSMKFPVTPWTGGISNEC